MNTSPSWVGEAWSHWHRPWAVTHAAWQDEPGAPVCGADDWVLRLHYPAWCEQRGLSPWVEAFEDNTWWKLLGLAPASFNQAARRVDLTLMFAADPRTRLVRRAGDDLAVMRWALGRAPFVPGSVADALRAERLSSSAAAYAALSMHWCMNDSPALRARLRLRFAPADLPPPDRPRRDPDAGVCAWLATLWAGSVRTAGKEAIP
jgi:hypothetical protein